MAKTATSAKRKKSSRVTLKRHEPFSARLSNPEAVKEVLVEALMHNDLETFQDVLVAYLRTASKSKLAAKTKLGRQTLYDLVNEDKEFNPTLSTLGSILEAIAA